MPESIKYINDQNLTLQNNKVNETLYNENYNTKTGKKKKEELVQKQIQELLIKNEELRRIDKTKNKMFSIIAHDLVNPFNSILGLSNLLKEQIDDFNKEKIIQFADLIHQTSSNTYKLLENLLEWSRAQTGKINYFPKKVPLNELIINTINIHKSQADKKSLYLNYDIKDSYDVFVDTNMINTIFRNLISNGIKFTEKGGVTITAEERKDHCMVCFSDTGKGISKEKIKSLFTYDIKTTEGTNGEIGSGLGLLLCKEFINQNNGEISVNSKINEGSTFCVTLPLFK